MGLPLCIQEALWFCVVWRQWVHIVLSCYLTVHHFNNITSRNWPTPQWIAPPKVTLVSTLYLIITHACMYPCPSAAVCNVELPPCCSPHLSPGPPSLRAQALSQFLQDTVLRYNINTYKHTHACITVTLLTHTLSSGCIDPSQLCIKEGKVSSSGVAQ